MWDFVLPWVFYYYLICKYFFDEFWLGPIGIAVLFLVRGIFFHSWEFCIVFVCMAFLGYMIICISISDWVNC